jgi:hypothetical protein
MFVVAGLALRGKNKGRLVSKPFPFRPRPSHTPNSLPSKCLALKQSLLSLAASQALPPRKTRPAPAWPQAHCTVEAPDVTGCRGASCSGHFPGQLAVVQVPPPPSGMGATARHHRASPRH